MAKLSDVSGLDEQGDNNEKVTQFLEALDLIRSEGQFEFADETLVGIYDYVKERMYVTEGQKKAVTNILQSKGKELEDYF